MFLEQRLANIESQLSGVLEALRDLRAGAFVEMNATPSGGVTMAAPPTTLPDLDPPSSHKHPDMAAERARIKSALMALRRAGGDPNAVLSKAGITRLSEVTTPEIVSAIDTLIDDDQ